MAYRPIFPPWYRIVGHVMSAGLVLSIIPLVFEILRLIEQNLLFHNHEWRKLYFLASVPLAVALVEAGWLAWVCPWLEAANKDRVSQGVPRNKLFLLQVMIWIPPIALALAAVAILAGFPLLLRVGDRRFWQGLRPSSFVGPAFLASAILSGLWTWWLAGRVRERLTTNARNQNICYFCGYDLRASEGDSCPECGQHR